jgi:hypothetical protein
MNYELVMLLRHAVSLATKLVRRTEIMAWQIFYAIQTCPHFFCHTLPKLRLTISSPYFWVKIDKGCGQLGSLSTLITASFDHHPGSGLVRLQPLWLVLASCTRGSVPAVLGTLAVW